MDKSKIFIASSHRASIVAEKLRDELRTADYCWADIWNDVAGRNPGQARIVTLEQLPREYDFAVIILAKADVLVKDLGDGLKSRDDCVFEAGFFMAAIGRDRCFLLSSVEQNELPTDLEGILRFKFTEPSDLTDRLKCTEKIQAASGLIKDQIQKVQKVPRGPAARPLSREALLEREKGQEEGGELKEDQVVVAAVQPTELGYEVAKQVRTNLDSNIRYVYFFQGNDDAADKVPQLLQLLLIAGFLDKRDAASFRARGDLVTRNRNEVLEALKDICVIDMLNIFFLDDGPNPQYSIHNATSETAARLYLKRGDEFLEWESGRTAHQFWSDMRKKTGANDTTQFPDAVFHGTRDFELKEGLFLRNLKMNMRKYFRDITDEVTELCLNGPR